jgi:ribosome-associated translation inhibitor RaiA
VVDIVFHAHHAVISDSMRDRAARAITKVANRVSRFVRAVVRFEDDGPACRVLIELHAAGRRILVEGRGSALGAALADATQRLQARVKRDPRARNRKHTMRTRRRAFPDSLSA